MEKSTINNIMPSSRYKAYYRKLLNKYYGDQGAEYVEKRLLGKLKKIDKKGKERVLALETEIGLKGKKVLDVGAGLGEFVISAVASGIEAYGIETDKEKVEIANEMLGETRLLYSIGDKLPYADNSFDLVTSFDVLEHVKNHSVFLKELVRVTKVGGHIYFKCANYLSGYEGHYQIKYFPPLTPKWLGSLLLRARGKNPLYWKTSIYPINHFKLLKIIKSLPVSITDLTKRNMMGYNTSGKSIKHLFHKLRVLIRRPFYPADEFLLRKYEMH